MHHDSILFPSRTCFIRLRIAKERPHVAQMDLPVATDDLNKCRDGLPDTQHSPGSPAEDDHSSTFSDILHEYYKKRDTEMAALRADHVFQAGCRRAREAMRRMEARFPRAPPDHVIIIDDDSSEEAGGNTVTPPRSPHAEEDYRLGMFSTNYSTGLTNFLVPVGRPDGWGNQFYCRRLKSRIHPSGNTITGNVETNKAPRQAGGQDCSGAMEDRHPTPTLPRYWFKEEQSREPRSRGPTSRAQRSVRFVIL